MQKKGFLGTYGCLFSAYLKSQAKWKISNITETSIYKLKKPLATYAYISNEMTISHQTTIGAFKYRRPAKHHICCRSFMDRGWMVRGLGWNGMRLVHFSTLLFTSFFCNFFTMVAKENGEHCCEAGPKLA